MFAIFSSFFTLNTLAFIIAAILCFSALCYVVADIISTRFTCMKDLNFMGISRPDGEKGNHAIVMGGGLAGIMSARVLLDHYQHVTIVESDSYDKDSERIRSAVPQGAHAHILLAIANYALQRLFVGIENIFIERGGRVSDLGTAMKWFYWGSFRVRCEMKYPFWCSSRPFLDQVVRDVFFEQFGDRVKVQTRRRIIGPVLSTDLPALLRKQEEENRNQQKSIHITGTYTNVALIDEASDEFRVVGIQVKRKSQNTSQNNQSSDSVCNDIQCTVPSNNNNNDNTTHFDDETDPYDVVTVETTVNHERLAKKISHPYNSASNIHDTEEWDECKEEYVIGDLVVDCTGACGLSEKWANSRWNIQVPVSELKAGSMYVSHLFREPEGFEADWICAPIYPVPGKSTRFGYLKRIEKGLWQVTGMATSYTTVDNSSIESFIEHFSKLDNPFIYHLLTTPDPKTGLVPQPLEDEKLHAYIPKMYIRRHFEHVAEWPEGLIAAGNAACVFDPVYGQGMSGVAIAALSLNTVLNSKQFQGKQGLCKNGFSHAYNKLFADRLEFPWALCVGEDIRWDRIASQGPRGVNNWFITFLQFWIRQGMMLAKDEPLAQRTAMGIMNMSISFTSLLYPPLVYLVFKNIALEYLGLVKTPEELYEEIDEQRGDQWPRKIISLFPDAEIQLKKSQ